MSGSHVFLQYVRRSFVLRWALLFAAFGIPLAVLAVSEGIRTHRRVQDFYPTRAEIQAKYRIGGRGGPSHFLLIRYLDRAGGQHERRVGASRGEYAEARRGDEIAAYVSGIDPSDAWLVSAGQPNYKRTEALAGVAGGMFVPLVAMLEWLRRRAAVLRDGHPVTGRVEKSGRDYRIRFSTKFHYRVTWSCTGPDGRLRRGKSLHVPKPFASKWRPGDEIEVYFDPRHPWLAEVDVYGMRNGDRK
ncbi:MAG TPA: DUF3592 domain-containing protein [Bryobacteraceae bacterium]|nr:DUF3592 domain-containing protein [Bryobacteraceae bacterium]